MPHKPGHLKPFTSFLTQGMQNTNQNINNAYMPTNIGNPNSQMSKPPSGLGAITPGPEYKNIWKDNYLSPPGMVSPGDINEFYKDPIAGAGETGMTGIDPFAPSGVKPDPGTSFNFNSQWFQGIMDKFSNMSNFLFPDNWLADLILNPDYINRFDTYPSDNSLPSNKFPSIVGIDAPPRQGEQVLFTEGTELESMPEEFAGGGGMAGQLAKRLYFPSTTGGFASTGSGVGGPTMNIMEMLQNMGNK